MDTTTDSAPERQLPRALLADHAEIDRLLRRLHDAAEANAQADLDRTWGELERVMLDHLAEEELYLFPALSAEHPREHAELVRDHARFRDLLAELGIAVELHGMRLETIDDLSDAVREHARREDAFLYPWAQRADAAGPRAARERARKRLARRP